VIPNVPLSEGTGALRKQWEKEEVESKWDGSVHAQARAKSLRRRELSDFERFKVMRLRKQVG